MTWTPPATTGGLAVTGYGICDATTPVVACAGSATVKATVGDITTDRVTGLTDGTPYYFVVAAKNADGFGPPSVAGAASATPAAVPAAPTLTGFKAGTGSVTVDWAAPTDGGSPITLYAVTATPASGTPLTVWEPGTARSATVRGLAPGTTYAMTVSATNGMGPGPPSTGLGVTTVVTRTRSSASPRYWVATPAGQVTAVGGAPVDGGVGDVPLNAPVVGMAATPTGGGYWEVAADGGIFTFGNARFLGSMGGKALNAPVVGMAATPTGGGYWEVARDGTLTAFGGAPPASPPPTGTVAVGAALAPGS